MLNQAELANDLRFQIETHQNLWETHDNDTSLGTHTTRLRFLAFQKQAFRSQTHLV